MADYTIDQIGYMLQKMLKDQEKIKEDLEHLLTAKEEQPLNTEEVAKMIGRSPRTVLRYIKEKNFPVIKPDGDKSRLVFFRKDINNWLKQNSL